MEPQKHLTLLIILIYSLGATARIAPIFGWYEAHIKKAQGA